MGSVVAAVGAGLVALFASSGYRADANRRYIESSYDHDSSLNSRIQELQNQLYQNEKQMKERDRQLNELTKTLETQLYDKEKEIERRQIEFEESIKKQNKEFEQQLKIRDINQLKKDLKTSIDIRIQMQKGYLDDLEKYYGTKFKYEQILCNIDFENQILTKFENCPDLSLKPNTIKVLLYSQTGAGKSYFANRIIGKDENGPFKVSNKPKSETQQIQQGTVLIYIFQCVAEFLFN